MMIVAAATGVDVDDVRLGVGRLAMQGCAGGDKAQLGVGSTTEANQNPDRREAIQVRGEVPHDGRRLLHCILRRWNPEALPLAKTRCLRYRPQKL